MNQIKTKEEIEKIRASCLLVCQGLALVGSMLKPGVTGKAIDSEVETLIRDHGAEPGFKGYRGFPNTLCISVNDVVVHGIPNDDPIREIDIVSVDCGVLMEGFYGDAAYTFALTGVEEDVVELIRVTKTSLKKGVEEAYAGHRIGDIGHAVQYYIEQKHHYSVVRELVGHGIGRNLHESPDVPNYGKRGRGVQLMEGMVLALEPMVNLGHKEVVQNADGWTIKTKDGLPSAHFEHTLAIGASKPDILSNHELIEDQIKNNPYLKEISIKC